MSRCLSLSLSSFDPDRKIRSPSDSTVAELNLVGRCVQVLLWETLPIWQSDPSPRRVVPRKYNPEQIEIHTKYTACGGAKFLHLLQEKVNGHVQPVFIILRTVYVIILM